MARNLIVELSWPAPANGHGPHLTSLMATEASWATVISSWFAARGCAGRARRRWWKSKCFRMPGLVSHRQNLLAPPLPNKWPSGSCMRAKAPVTVVMPA